MYDASYGKAVTAHLTHQHSLVQVQDLDSGASLGLMSSWPFVHAAEVAEEL